MLSPFSGSETVSGTVGDCLFKSREGRLGEIANTTTSVQVYQVTYFMLTLSFLNDGFNTMMLLTYTLITYSFIHSITSLVLKASFGTALSADTFKVPQ